MRNVHIPHFSGVPRQRGRGLGALAGTIARIAFPILKRFVVPAAKKIGRDAIDIAIPQVEDVLSGKSCVKKAIKKTASSTFKKIGGHRKKIRRSRAKAKRFISKRKKRKRSREDFSKKVKSNVCPYSSESLLVRCF